MQDKPDEAHGDNPRFSEWASCLPSQEGSSDRLIMVPHRGIEYMAGGTNAFHPNDYGTRALVGKATATPKSKPLGKRKINGNTNTNLTRSH